MLFIYQELSLDLSPFVYEGFNLNEDVVFVFSAATQEP